MDIFFQSISSRRKDNLIQLLMKLKYVIRNRCIPRLPIQMKRDMQYMRIPYSKKN